MVIYNLKDNINLEDIKKASDFIKSGKLVIFPTETVYGIGADGLNSDAINDIFKAKGRKNDNPLILHVSSIDMVYRIAKNINDTELKLMNRFFPGPLTIIFDKNECVPYAATGGLDTVGIRMPSNIIANKLIEYSDTPIAAPSANVSGKPSGTNISDIIDELGNKVSCIIDGGDTKIGVESTVVRVINNKIHILRPGYVTKEMLEEYGEVIIDKHILGDIEENDKVLSPGMKYKHYAPNTKCVMVYSKDNNKLISKIKELETSNTLVICNELNKKNYKKCISYGTTLEDIAHNIFKILREVDNYNVDLVIIEGVEKEGLGLAIMNRLIRACSHNYIEIK
ncbi:MAG: threonylcarbamoyl-AMP synthase [Bacilli bacterium]|nr:threonylcarbamoyl-AMP synthase [Bacilli bacterium]